MQPVESAVEGGFAQPVLQSAKAFRTLMTAMARPGDIGTVAGATPPAPLSVAAGVSVLTLCDAETPVFLAPSYDTDAVRGWINFQTGAPFARVSEAMFAIGAWDEIPVGHCHVGTPEYPDRSATIIAEVARLASDGATLSGPGIADTALLSLPDISGLRDARFPLGLDVYFTCGDRIAGLPRSTKISPQGRVA